MSGGALLRRKKDYTFFSVRRNSFSRINYFIIPENWKKKVKKVGIDQRIYSDHAVVILSLKKQEPPMVRVRRLNNVWLGDHEVRGKIQEIYES